MVSLTDSASPIEQLSATVGCDCLASRRIRSRRGKLLLELGARSIARTVALIIQVVVARSRIEEEIEPVTEVVRR